jgi:hypothetical protein
LLCLNDKYRFKSYIQRLFNTEPVIMHEVTLISTEHVESGKCNSDELYTIIENIRPDVIFEEETDDDKHQSYYNDEDSFKSLEIKTISKYKQHHDIINIPVDIAVNQYLSFKEWDYMFKHFKQYTVYKQLEKEHCGLRDKYGFGYINSERCFKLFEKKQLTENQLIGFNAISKDHLNRIYTLFHKEHDEREHAMLENIYQFSKENPYNQAVFLLGFAHRKSMEKKILEYESKDSFKINWSFYRGKELT